MSEVLTSPELQLLFLSGRPLLQPDEQRQFREIAAQPRVNWHELLGLAAKHRVLPLLYGHLKSTKAEVSQGLGSELKRLNERIVARNLMLAAELLSLNNTFRREGVRSVWFKGPVLACQAYGNVSQRQSIDIDVLIPRKRIDDVNRLMLENGYVPAFKLMAPRQQRLHEKISTQHSFSNPRNGIWVDVHWALTESGYSFSMDRSLPTVDLNLLGQDIKTFEPGASLCYLCYHGTKHGWNSIGWISDVVQLVQRYPEAVSDYLTGSTRPLIGTNRTLRLGVLLGHELLGMPLSSAQYSWTSLDPKARVLSERVQQISLRSLASADDAVYLGTMGRSSDKIRFIWRKLMMPSALELERVTLPNQLFFVYRILRWFRLLGKYLWRGTGSPE